MIAPMSERSSFECQDCGETFYAFLHDMAEHNAKVVCPKCGKVHDTPHASQNPTS
jgi:predicted RNA-binding Zn-ribbon protein involved in translation (DUF1610 family)